MKIKGRSNDWLLLSAYLDGEITAREKEKLERRLSANPQLREKLNELKTTRAMIRSLPRKKAPRSFALTPEMVRQRKTSGWLSLLGLTSAASAILAMVLLFFQFAPGILFNGGMMAASEPQQEIAMFAEESAEGESEPEIIYWGGPPAPLPEGMGGGDASEMVPYQEAPLYEAPQAIAPKEPPGVEEEAMPAPVEQIAPDEESPAEPALSSEAEEETADREAGAVNPILGILPTPEAKDLSMTPYNAPQSETVSAEKATITVVILLAGLALASGVAAFILWRRLR